MSVRTLGLRLFKHGISILRNANKQVHNGPTFAHKINAPVSRGPRAPSLSTATTTFGLRDVGVQLGLQARRILIDNVLSRVTNSLAGELRRKAAKRILYGDSGPFFALVGVSLASGTGILTKEEELEGVCWEIREAVSKIDWSFNDTIDNTPLSLDDIVIGGHIAKGATAAVYAANLKTERSPAEPQFPFALKMMFNYDIQSNSTAILNAMYKETVPARVRSGEIEGVALGLSKRCRPLPPHPNIVAMYSVFTDFVPELEDCRGLYPAALPQRIHPEGEGRNMSLFLLMKRYDTCLKDFLTVNPAPSTRTSVLLFSQLLEAITHLVCHQVAHRDLKTDNLLVDLSEPEAPILVVTDFGCCLSGALGLPYNSYDVDKGGNAALMAPEIMTATPGIFTVLDYEKADLWAAGAIGYEIFGRENPFYKGLKSGDYREEDLPELPEEVPQVFKKLVECCLKRSPSKRLRPEIAANVCQLYLWAPSAWLKADVKPPSSAEILQWLLSLTTKVLCEGKRSTSGAFQSFGRRTLPEYLLISSFLSRAKLANIRAALAWIQNVQT